MSSEGYLITAVSVVSGVVAVLFKIFLDKWNASEKERKEEKEKAHSENKDWMKSVMDKFDAVISAINEESHNHKMEKMRLDNVANDLREYKTETAERFKSMESKIETLSK